MATPSQSYLRATGAAQDIANLDAKALAALVPAMAAAQKELSVDLAAWMAKLGPNAADQKFTPAMLLQVQTILGVAQAKAGLSSGGYPHASFPMVVAKAYKDAMGQNMPQKLAVQTLTQQLDTLAAKFKDLPSPQLVQAALLAKGDHLVWSQFKNSANRYAGQVGTDLKLQFGIGLSKGETLQQLTKRIAGLSEFQKAVDASHPTQAGNAMAGALTKRYHNWAKRLATTEMAGAYNKIALDGIKLAHSLDDRVVAVWDASNDLRVCLQCKALHGDKVKPGELFKGGIMKPPAHPYCRCAIVSWVDDWADDNWSVPSVEEVEAKEKAIQFQQDNRQAARAREDANKTVAKEDLAAYEAHKLKEAQIAQAKLQAEAAAKAKAEADAYAAKLAAEQKAAEADAAAAKLKAETLAAKKAAAAAKKAAMSATPAPFNLDSSPSMGAIPHGKKKGQEYILNKGGMVLTDKNTIQGHGYTLKWNPDYGAWYTETGPANAGFKWDWKNNKWTVAATPPAPAAQAKPIVAAAPPPVLGPKPKDIVGHDWVAVNGQWVIHKGGVPTSTLVKPHDPTNPVALDYQYVMGGDLAKKGLVPTALGKMEGHGYVFELEGGMWVKKSYKGAAVAKPAINSTLPSPSYGYSPPAYSAPVGWKPTPITLAANRHGVTDFNKMPSKEFAGFHGKAFSQDGDVIEGGSMKVLKVKGQDGAEYFEATFKVTHPYGSAAQSYGTGTAHQWTFNARGETRGVMHDKKAKETADGKVNIHTGKDHTLEVGTKGAMQNHVRIRAKSLAELNEAMDRFGEHMGKDLRKPPEKEDLVLQAKARLVAKFDPKAFGSDMAGVSTADEQKEVIERYWTKITKTDKELAKHLADAQEMEVYPGLKTLYSPSLGKRLAKEFPRMIHDGSPPAKIAASIASDTGLMSSAKRYSSGVFTEGMSTSTDFGTGGADGVFMRVQAKDKVTDSGGAMRVVIDSEKVLGRLDWWAFNEDNYGRSSYGSYNSRWSVPAMKAGTQESGNEVMAPQGVPPSAMKALICRSSTYRNEVLDELRKNKITQINGIPIEQFVQLGR